jgi:hypothetical protein
LLENEEYPDALSQGSASSSRDSIGNRSQRGGGYIDLMRMKKINKTARTGRLKIKEIMIKNLMH